MMRVAGTKASPDSEPTPLSSMSISQSATLPVVVYTTESPLRHPVKLVRDLFAELWASRELIWMLFIRDLKAMYRQSYLGYAWIFAPPLVTTAVWLFLNSQRIVQVGATPIPYPAFVLVGTMLWTTFSTAVTQPLVSFTAGKPVFTKLQVPPEAFVAAGMAKILFEFLIRVILLVPVFFILGVFPPATALLFPFAIVCLFLLAAAAGTLLIPLGALYQDVERTVGMMIGFLMYLAPVVYPPAKSGWAATLIGLNPVTPIIMTARDWLTLGSSEYVLSMLIVAAVSLLVLFIAALILRVAMPHLVARMGM